MLVVEGIPSSMTGDGLIVLGINFNTLAHFQTFHLSFPVSGLKTPVLLASPRCADV